MRATAVGADGLIIWGVAVFSVEEGKTLGRFVIRRFLGRGGMGVVYEAWDTRLERRVAIKLLHSDLLSEDDAAERFKQEARRAARIEHAHVVRIYGIEEFEDTSIIEMQYIDGRPLQNVIGRAQLSGGDAASLLRQVLCALAACHAQDIIHCDLKPGNLIVTSGWHVYLSDFGIARALRTADTITAGMSAHSGPLWGTPQYSPPEAWADAPPTPQWDLYAAGVLIYETLSGERAFNADNPMAIINNVLSGTFEPLEHRRPDISPEFLALVRALMSRRPEDRPATAEAALRALAATPEAEAAGEDVQTATPLTPANRAEIEALRRQADQDRHKISRLPHAPRWARAAMAATALLVAVAAGWALLRENNPAPGYAGEGGPNLILPSLREPSIEITPANQGAYFTFDDGFRGRELWCYDVDTDNYGIVADINPGPPSSNPRCFQPRPAGGAFFAATTEQHGEELWRVSSHDPRDHTANLVKDIMPGAMSSNPQPQGVHEHLLLFYATTLQHGTELWCTNGAPEQTAMVADLQPGTGSSYPGHPLVLPDEQGAYAAALSGGGRG